MKLKQLLKETITWNSRKFGERLPTLDDYKEAYDKKEKVTEDSVSPSFRQMINMMSNGIPMMFKKEEGGLQAKYYYKVMQNGDVGVFIQALSVGDPKAIKLWPKVEKVIKKNIDDYYKEDIMIKQKLNTERNKMWMMMGKFGKKLKV